MKGSMKKLAVLVIIVAIAMFFVGAMASADDQKGKKVIRGQYSGTGGGTCIIAPFGFNIGGPTDLTPNCASPLAPCAFIQLYSREGDYNFEHDGTGSFTGTGRAISQIYPGPLYVGPSGPSAGLTEVSFDFTYTVTDSGTVTIKQVPGTYFSEWTSGPNAGKIIKMEKYETTGSITPDGKGMNLASGAPARVTLQQVFPTVGLVMDTICNFDTILIWQHE